MEIEDGAFNNVRALEDRAKQSSAMPAGTGNGVEAVAVVSTLMLS